jgi:phage shock protein PspC (stress-responsive transcriptional regulator)
MSYGLGIALIIAVLIAGYVKSQGVKRSRDSVIAGVCSGIARKMGWDLTVTRVIAFILACMGGCFIYAYIIMWIILDEE